MQADSGQTQDVQVLTDNGVLKLWKVGRLQTRDCCIYLQVLSIYRGLKDSHFHRVLGTKIETQTSRDQSSEPNSVSSISTNMDPNFFDIVLSDGRKKIKVLLSPSLNHLVYLGFIRPLSIVKVIRRLKWFDELVTERRRVADHSDEGFIILEDLSITTSKSGLIAFNEEIEFLLSNEDTTATQSTDSKKKKKTKEEKEREKRTALVPLVGHRRCYFSIFNQDCAIMNFSVDEKYAIWPSSVDDIEYSSTISEVIFSFEERVRKNSKFPPLVARIMRKSKLFVYGKPSDQNCAYPLRFSIDIADESGQVPVVFWEVSCKHHFALLNIGDIVTISNYRIRKRYGNTEGVEFSINVSNPAGEVVPLSEEQLSYISERKLPDLELNLKSIEKIADSVCNKYEELITNPQEITVAGVITFVGRIEVLKSKFSDHLAQEYRFIKIVDALKGREMSIKLFAGSYMRSFRFLAEGNIICLTDVNVVVYSSTSNQESKEHQTMDIEVNPLHVIDNDWVSSVYCVSTAYSQLYIGPEQFESLPEYPLLKYLTQKGEII